MNSALLRTADWRWTVLGLLMSGFMLLASAYLAQAAPPSQSAEEGEALFQQYCAGCHTVGGGDLAGPDLLGVADRRDPEWLEHWLAEPDVMLAEGDPIAVELLAQYNNVPMPNQNLTLSEIDALLAYLGVVQPSLPGTPTEQAALVGRAETGRALFTGSQALAAGAAACIACHDTAEVGLPGGGLLGPDLTQVVQRYGGEAGLRATLGTIPFPSMVPLYQNRPLSPQEQADLAAFLARSTTEAAPTRGLRHGTLFLLAFGAMDILLIGLFLWQRRLPHHRRLPLARRLGSSNTE
jgi:mono/diheme cytochrome c family protein